MARVELNLDDGYFKRLQAMADQRGCSVQAMIIALIEDRKPAQLKASSPMPTGAFNVRR